MLRSSGTIYGRARPSPASRGARASCSCARTAPVRARSLRSWRWGETRSGGSRTVTESRGWRPCRIFRVRVDPGRFPPLQIARTVALACRKPAELDLPQSQWSLRTLTAYLVEQDIFTSVHYSSVCLILQNVDLQPHRVLYWKRGHDPEFERKALHVLRVYERIQELEARREPVFALDEKTGIQLLGRLYP